MTVQTELLVDMEQEIEEKQKEDEENVSQISQNIISYTQLYSIETLYAKLKNGSLGIPSFQRREGLWSFKNKSLFIESIILNLPVPSIVVFTDSKLNYQVIDGLQRVSTIKDFIEGKFDLSGLTQENTEGFNGLKFDGLPINIKNQIYNSTISVITVQCTPDDDRSEATYYEIFRRLNQGGLVLTPQEIRNAIYKGPFLEFLKGSGSESDGIRNNEIWVEFYKNRGNQQHNYARQRDIELLLKIFALAELKSDIIPKNMGDFLNSYLLSANKKNDDEIKKLEEAFLNAMHYIKDNDIIAIFLKYKIKQSIWYSMLTSVLLSKFLENPEDLPRRNYVDLITRTDLPDASKDTWNSRKLNEWKSIFIDFISN